MKEGLRKLGWAILTAPVRVQTYLNLVYLILCLPLGMFYWGLIGTGVMINFPLVFVGVGLLGLIAVLWMQAGLVVIERQMTIWMLGVPVGAHAYPALSSEQKFGTKTGLLLQNPVTWKALAYFGAKVMVGGISSFFLFFGGLFATVFLLCPVYFQVNPIHIHLTLDGVHYAPAWWIDTPFEAALMCVAGVLLVWALLVVHNGLAWVMGKLACWLLGNSAERPDPFQSGDAGGMKPTDAETRVETPPADEVRPVETLPLPEAAG